jgi:hypothetical protein
LTAASVVLLIARIVDLPRWFDFGLIMAMTLIAYGTALGLYGNWFYYDKVVHGLSPVGYVPVLYIALVRLGVVPDPGEAIRERRVARISGIFIVTLAGRDGGRRRLRERRVARGQVRHPRRELREGPLGYGDRPPL